jgi:hypothetical protein
MSKFVGQIGIGVIVSCLVGLVLAYTVSAKTGLWVGLATGVLILLLVYGIDSERKRGQDPWKVIITAPAGAWRQTDWSNDQGHTLEVRPETQSASISAVRCVLRHSNGERSVAEDHVPRNLSQREEVRFRYPAQFSHSLSEPLDARCSAQWLVQVPHSVGAIEVTRGQLEMRT